MSGQTKITEMSAMQRFSMFSAAVVAAGMLGLPSLTFADSYYSGWGGYGSSAYGTGLCNSGTAYSNPYHSVLGSGQGYVTPAAGSCPGGQCSTTRGTYYRPQTYQPQQTWWGYPSSSSYYLGSPAPVYAPHYVPAHQTHYSVPSGTPYQPSGIGSVGTYTQPPIGQYPSQSPSGVTNSPFYD